MITPDLIGLREFWRLGSFDQLPHSVKVTVFGVEYVPLRLSNGDDLFLTRYGWPWRDHLLPERWYHEGCLSRRGERLLHSTGTVYRVPTLVGGRRLTTVVKVSRVAQDLDHYALLSMPDPAFAPEFNDPFEEFALVERLRSATRGPRITTKRPLAIFSPNTRHQLWQLERDESRFARHAGRLAHDQAGGALEAVRLDLHRSYILIFEWIDGLNLLEMVAHGIIDERRLWAIMEDVTIDLEGHRFRVFDHKPDHVIFRLEQDRTLPVRNSRWAYAIADYELLVALPGGSGVERELSRLATARQRHGVRARAPVTGEMVPFGTE